MASVLVGHVPLPAGPRQPEGVQAAPFLFSRAEYCWARVRVRPHKSEPERGGGEGRTGAQVTPGPGEAGLQGSAQPPSHERSWADPLSANPPPHGRHGQTETLGGEAVVRWSPRGSLGCPLCSPGYSILDSMRCLEKPPLTLFCDDQGLFGALFIFPLSFLHFEDALSSGTERSPRHKRLH